MQVGDLATWVAAVGTAGTLMVSVFLLFRDHKERVAKRLGEERHQASLVAAWIEAGGSATGQARGSVQNADLIVVNQSDQPVYDVLILTAIRPDMLTPNQSVDVSQTSLPAFAPSFRQAFHLAFTVPPPASHQTTFPLGQEAFVMEMLFTDASGRSWVRTHKGKLMERGDEWGELIALPTVERIRRIEQM